MHDISLPAPPAYRGNSPHPLTNRHLWALALALVVACGVFLFWGGGWQSSYILQLRLVKLGGLLCVGASVGVATVLFQTLTNNRILTPAIMGFDALFLLMKTVLVFFSTALSLQFWDNTTVFLGDTAMMIGATMAIFAAVLRRARHDIQLLVLVGVIFGLLFRTITGFLQRLLDPSEFAMLQADMFAQFGGIDRDALTIAATLMGALFIWLAGSHRRLDVLALGRNSAQSLGLRYDRLQLQVLAAIAVLVSVSTALVGPLAFLGLLVSALTHSLMRSHRHGLLLPAAALIACLILVTGQTLFERILNLQSSLAVVIEFCGGLLFLTLLARGKIK
ncbi:iron chelate uptake ABC transporter family permease subunit [Thalassobius sp. Cn5-15]|uniref:iron chelate uptake ABC transporter family permease subunit n=1 Tax=Thalassobius sp. Cn5-15 TaxID=2917763 RepID=UPI001EF3C6EC|nr:iron chelate uptake ABC transporter family permease subunit [Thalassobius sp. Cn5-15]MCG7494230.1 iron chelate uptake ABC transporter family permease subunit [Thalassobius sp. Cn5-15]